MGTYFSAVTLFSCLHSQGAKRGTVASICWLEFQSAFFLLVLEFLRVAWQPLQVTFTSFPGVPSADWICPGSWGQGCLREATAQTQLVYQSNWSAKPVWQHGEEGQWMVYCFCEHGEQLIRGARLTFEHWGYRERWCRSLEGWLMYRQAWKLGPIEATFIVSHTFVLELSLGIYSLKGY